MSPAPDGAAGRRALAAIWSKNRDEMRRRVQTLETAADALLRRGLSAEIRTDARREAHRLAGSLGTYGLSEGSEVARALEARLDEARPFEDEEVRTFCDRVVRLARLVERHDEEISRAGADPGGDGPGADAEGRGGAEEGGAEEGGPEEGGAAVIDAEVGSAEVVAADRSPATSSADAEGATVATTPRGRPTKTPLLVWTIGLAEPGRLEDHLRARDATLRVFPDAESAQRLLGDEAPDALLIRDDEAHRDGLDQLIQAVRADTPRAPVIVLGDEADLDARVRLAGIGVDRLLDHRLAPDELLVVLDELANRAHHAERILFVDDDPTTIDALTPALADRGYEVTPLSDPRSFWRVLEATDPALVLMDLDMPEHDGLALCRAMRTDPRWSVTPVMFLSAERSPAVRERAWAAGGDDFVEKPAEPHVLIARLDNRLRRQEVVRASSETDPETGLLPSAAGRAEGQRLVELAQRERRTTSVAAVVLATTVPDPLERDERRRHLATTLRRHMRVTDVLYDDGETVFVVAYGLDKDALSALVQRALNRLQGPDRRTQGKAVVTAAPEDGKTLAALTEVARDRLAEAAVGTVTYAGDTGRAAVERPDIAIVDDDETVASLLRHALEGQGYRVAWIADGQEADRLLAGSDPPVRPRLILLDVNLPGLDGLSLLRRLADTGILGRTRVIMLTVRSLEAEVLQALRLGADDHVPKPFSVPVLIQRIRHVLGG